MTLPVKPINEIEEKSEVGVNDKILILDADSEEARLASKDELKGDKGDQGDPGTPGADGQDGAAATIAVGTTSTLPAGSSATVTNSGTSTAAVFNFSIPKGDKGDQGNPGQDGTDGTDGNGITSVTSSKVGKTTTVTMNFDEGDPYSFQVQDGADGVGGDVFGPASSTDGHLAVFDGATGKKIKDGGAMPTIPTKVSDLSNDSGFITGITSGDVTTALGYTPADSASLGTAATKNTGTSSGNVPVLDSNGKLANSTLPGVALTDTFTVSTSSDLTSLSSAEQGDLAIVTSENKTYVLSAEPYSTAANWKEILSPTGGVTSVNSQTGAVTVEEFNATNGGTKLFAFPDVSDDISDLVTWLTNGGSAIIGDEYGYCLVTSIDTSGREIKAECPVMLGYKRTWTIAYNASKVVTSETYTDDYYFNPGGTATTGYVVTKTAGGYEWAAPSGGDVMVSSQSGNILTSGMKIWAGLETDYQNLGSYDQNTVYLTI